ncbi:MAG TPA: 50S ribosomal protein L10 [Patescibacteria group bacterium]
MPVNKKQKEEIVSDLVDKLKKSKSVIFVNFDQVTVSEIEEFRQLCREQAIDYSVSKKTLLKIAMDKGNLKEVDPLAFENGVGTLFSYDDEVAPAKIVKNFSKLHENLKMIGGILASNPEGQRYLALAEVENLSMIPSKDELLARVVGSLNAPVAGLVGVLSGNLRQLVYVLNAIGESKQ